MNQSTELFIAFFRLVYECNLITTNQPCLFPLRPKFEVNLALVGPLGCGKSALAVRYITKRYIGEYDPKLGERAGEGGITAALPIRITFARSLWIFRLDKHGRMISQKRENKSVFWSCLKIKELCGLYV